MSSERVQWTDPTSSRSAQVTSDGMLVVLAAKETRLANVSRETGEAYSWSNVTYDYVAANTILAVENNSATKLLVIDSIWAYGDTFSQVKVSIQAGVAMAGTAAAAVALNRGSGKVPEATAMANETGNAVAAANLVGNFYILTAGESTYLDCKGAIVLGNDDCVAVDYVTEGAVANVTILGHYVEA